MPTKKKRQNAEVLEHSMFYILHLQTLCLFCFTDLVDRLAGDAGVRVDVLEADGLGVRVRDPGHLALARAHVRGGHVDTGPWGKEEFILLNYYYMSTYIDQQICIVCLSIEVNTCRMDCCRKGVYINCNVLVF